MQGFLENSTFIDWQESSVAAKAATLASQAGQGVETVARACFEFVRDEIKHSVDYQLNPITCRASEVLKYKTGFCYAKSHLLAALLRANEIPCALIYQRLRLKRGAYVLHGLNSVYLKPHGWYRIDARGDGNGLVSRFAPPTEQLPFKADDCGEQIFETRFSKPLEEVISVLTKGKHWSEVSDNLPDNASLT
jgi:transglutaminase-like putative cysteine protease